jgi:Holliday junction resolvase RusA-like endonuclease
MTFFIPYHPRVGGFAGRERRRRERYRQPALDEVERPFPRRFRLRVEYRFVFEDPAFDHSGGRRIHRTDIDNMLKFVNDLLTGVVWEDDSQIFELLAVKEHGPEVGIEVRVWVLAEAATNRRRRAPGGGQERSG